MDLPDSPRPAPSTSTTSTASTTEEAKRTAAQQDLAPLPKRRGLDLSLSQVVGGSLAAATAAALTSKLGLAGTILGAAGISLVTALAGALYTQSLRRTQARVRAAAARAAPAYRPRGGATPPPDDDTADRDEAVRAPDGAARDDGPRTGRRPHTGDVVPHPAPRAGALLAGLNLRRVVLSTVAVFALALAGLTGFELATGQSVSGVSGTTIGELARVGQDPGGTGTGGQRPDREPARSTSPDSEPVTEPDAPTSTPAPTTGDPEPGPTPSGDPTPTTPPAPTEPPISTPAPVNPPT